MSREVESRCANFRLAIPNDAQMGSFVQSEPTEVGVLSSLMTGLRPDQLGVWTLPIHFREAMPTAVTLPQWFRSFGYTPTVD
jgi:hypothetical protein